MRFWSKVMLLRNSKAVSEALSMATKDDGPKTFWVKNIRSVCGDLSDRLVKFIRVSPLR